METIDLATLMRNDFQAHLEKTCNILYPTDPFEPNWHHRAMPGIWNKLPQEL